MKKLLLTSTLLVSAVITACASDNMQTIPVKTDTGILTGTNGMTLYTFDNDIANSGKSVCNDKCAEYWPPLFAHDDSKASGDYTIITRDYGTKQWAFKGKPLYFWVKDKKPGDTTGDGFRNIWRIVKP